MIQNAGTQLVGSSDAAIGSSGVAVRVFGIHILSGGGGAAVVSLRNGIAAGATAYITETGTTSTGKTFSYGTQGVLFPAGCFCDVDSNTPSVAVVFNYAS